MKTKNVSALVCVALVACTGLVLAFRGSAATQSQTLQAYEYATIRWSGKEFTHLIRPSGQIEMIGALFPQGRRQEHVDERALCLSIAMNALAKEGYELAGLTDNEVVMKRSVAR